MILNKINVVPGPPVCSRRWSSSSLTSLTISWQPPTQPNGVITGYFLELVSFDNGTVLQSGNGSNALSYTFTGLTIIGNTIICKRVCALKRACTFSAAGVPYHVRVYAENIYGRGGYCMTTDFGDQLSRSIIILICFNYFTTYTGPPTSILSDLTSSYDASDLSTLFLTWTVLPLDQTKGYVTLSITFGPLVSTGPSKRQAPGESMDCSQSPCQVPYEQGRVTISGLDSQQDQFVVITPENEEGETGTLTAYRITSMTLQCPNAGTYMSPPCKGTN